MMTSGVRSVCGFEVPHNMLNGLKHSRESNTVKLSNVIDTWINTNEATRDKVISAIGGPIVGNTRKADEIHDHLTNCNKNISIFCQL